MKKILFLVCVIYQFDIFSKISLNFSYNKKTNIFEVKNYNKSLLVSEEDIMSKFCELVNEYLFHITENIIIQDRNYYIR